METKIKLLVALGIVLSGCVGQIDENGFTGTEPVVMPTDQLTVETMEAVISAWSDVYDVTVTPAQRNKVYSIHIYPVSKQELQKIFNTTSNTLMGKATNDGIWYRNDIPKNQQYALLAHELVHRIGWVMIRDFDNCHANVKMFSCEGSVEETATDYLDTSRKSYNSAYTCNVSTCTKK